MGLLEDFGRISSATLSLLKNPAAVAREVSFLLRSNPADYYAFLGDDVLEAQNEGFRDPRKPLWLNLGYWETARIYPEACQAMARTLAEAAQLGPEDIVVDCGFGFGDQDMFWAEQYGVRRILGLNVTPLHVQVAQERVKAVGLGERIELMEGSATAMPFEAESATKVLALESAFHFDTREDFFREAFRVLRPGGRIATADCMPMPGETPAGLANWLGQRRWGLPRANLYDRNEYLVRLEKAGFVNATARSIRNHVFPGMGKYAEQRNRGVAMHDVVIELTQQEIDSCKGVEVWAQNGGLTDYVIISAEKPR